MRLLMIGMAIAAGLPQMADQHPALTPGTVTVELADAKQRAIEPVAIDAVSEALTDAGFLILPGEGHGRYVAQVTIEQEGRGPVTTKSKGAGALFGGGVASISTPSPAQLNGLVVTRLTLDLATREDGARVWHGAASTAQVQGTAAGASAAVAKKLADAIIRRFPQPMDQPISVP